MSKEVSLSNYKVIYFFFSKLKVLACICKKFSWYYIKNKVIYLTYTFLNFVETVYALFIINCRILLRKFAKNC